MAEQEIVRLIREGLEVPGAKILERRTRGLALIRRQLIGMMFKYTAYRGESSLAFRWRGLGNLANARTLTDAAFDLVMHEGAKEIKGRFPDLWVLCYPDDMQIKEKVEAQLADMCAQFGYGAQGPA